MAGRHEATNMSAGRTRRRRRNTDVARSPGFVAIHITMRRGRTTAKKRALYRAIADRVHDATGTRIEDVMIVLSENESIDWSFGGGVAQYSPGD